MVEERASTVPRPVRRVFDDDGFTPMLETDAAADWRMVLTDAAATPWAYVGPDRGVSTLDLTTWGEVADRSGEGSKLRFAGQRADELTGLHYNRHRYYAPDLHVFLTPDPLGMLSTMQDVGYVRNVTIFIDPSGLVTIVTGDPGDGTIKESVRRLQAEYPGAKVITSDKLGKPPSLWQKVTGKGKDVNMIDPNEDHVIVTTHGAPGTVNWKGAEGRIGHGRSGRQPAQRGGLQGRPRQPRPGAERRSHGVQRRHARLQEQRAERGAGHRQRDAGATTWGAKARTKGDPYDSPPVSTGQLHPAAALVQLLVAIPAGNVEGKDYIPGCAGKIHAGEMSGTPHNPTVHGGTYECPTPRHPVGRLGPPGPPGDQAWWGSE